MQKSLNKFLTITLIFTVFISSVLLSGCGQETTSDGENENQEDCIAEGDRGQVSPNSKSCCSGLSGITCDKPDSDGVCSTSCTEEFICTACGDGECNNGENKCNCPKDCK
jgi:hypothetical protein